METQDCDVRRISLFGVDYAVTDYVQASRLLVEFAIRRESYGVSALAVHGLIVAVRESWMAEAMQKINMILPDGQPVRWALNSFYSAGLSDRVYGPQLTLKVLERANHNRLKVFLYGSTRQTLEKFAAFIERTYPGVILCGQHIDRFREATPEEDEQDIEKINNSGANIVLVGRGCPRQELWVANHIGKINAVMMAVGAAFDFHAGLLPQAPKWMQDRGLEWLFRLIQEPRRLWKRYLITNSYFIYLFIKHKFILRRPS